MFRIFDNLKEKVNELRDGNAGDFLNNAGNTLLLCCGTTCLTPFLCCAIIACPDPSTRCGPVVTEIAQACGFCKGPPSDYEDLDHDLSM